ncbi:MAG: PqiC family protein [Pseudomonadota bacterium]|nr:PqiC family protein [Pseudomonadota bacterium]
MSLITMLALAGTLMLTACASPQIRFHTLMPAPGPSKEINADAHISVNRVTVPAQVNRSELVVRKNAGELMVLASDWWGAGLPEELRSSLAAGFGPGGTETPRVGLRLQVTRFDFVPGEEAWLEARYRVTALDGDNKRRLSCSVSLRTAVPEDAGDQLEALVLAQQENLRRLIRHITKAASSLATEQECPLIAGSRSPDRQTA